MTNDAHSESTLENGPETNRRSLREAFAAYESGASLEKLEGIPDESPFPSAASASTEPRSYTTIFFDLDGTLLPMDTDIFMKGYTKSLGAFMAAHGMDAETTMRAVFAGVKAMAKNDGSISNAEVFWKEFETLTGLSAEETEPLFTEYYQGSFNSIAETVTANPATARAIATLKSKGYRLAVTTMPMFPLVAVEARIGWAGLNPADFIFATDYANSTSIKPYARFYEEALRRANANAEHVLMVGNHTREDGWATNLGCDIYFVTDHLIESEDGLTVDQCKHGSMEDFARFCETLPNIA